MAALPFSAALEPDRKNLFAGPFGIAIHLDEPLPLMLCRRSTDRSSVLALHRFERLNRLLAKRVAIIFM